MLRVPNFAISLFLTALSTAALLAADLSSYRGFKFGMSLVEAEKKAEMNPSRANAIHKRPALIQQFEWRPGYVPGVSAELDSVKNAVFSFYNNELFRVVVNYDGYRTEGLTAQDMVEAISVNYGSAATPEVEIIFASSSLSYGEKVKAIARWEDSEYSFNLVRSPYQPGFALVGSAKRLDALAKAAVVEATRLDAQEAPQREANERQRQANEVSAKQEKARIGNKPGFRP